MKKRKRRRCLRQYWELLLLQTEDISSVDAEMEHAQKLPIQVTQGAHGDLHQSDACKVGVGASEHNQAGR